MTKKFIVPAMAAARGLEVVEDRLALGPAGETLMVKRPREPGVLLDLDEVYQHFEKDEYMPYWGTLWPVSQHMARFMLHGGIPLRGRALELGCGLGLAGCAALKRGMHVTFSDYDESALEWVAQNARLNGGNGANFATVAIDWRTPPKESFDLVIASDVIYESRSVGPLVDALAALIGDDGIGLVADQNRPYAPEFRAALAAAGFAFEVHEVGPDAAIDPDAKGTIYVMRWL